MKKIAPILSIWSIYIYNIYIYTSIYLSIYIMQDDDFNLAIKMMFNYDAASNALTILRAMQRCVLYTVYCACSISASLVSITLAIFQKLRTKIPLNNYVFICSLSSSGRLCRRTVFSCIVHCLSWFDFLLLFSSGR